MSQSAASIRQQADDFRKLIATPNVMIVTPPSQAAYEQSNAVPLRREGSSAPFLIAFFVVLITVLFWWYGGKGAETSFLPQTVANGEGVVDVNELYLRERPSQRSAIKFILPRGTKVVALDQYHRTLLGTIWVKVRVQTPEGLQEGWVDNKYVLRT